MRFSNIILIFLFSFQIVVAQYRDNPFTQFDVSKLNPEQFSFGVKATPSISWLNIIHDDMEADGATMKIGAGIVAKYKINSILSVISGVNFNGIGGYVFDNMSLDDMTTKDNYKINYLQTEVPLGLRLQSPFLQKTSFFVQGGFLTGFILEANEKRQSIVPNSSPQKTEIIELTNPSTVGFFGGVGMQYRLIKSLKFFTEINYKNNLF